MSLSLLVVSASGAEQLRIAAPFESRGDTVRRAAGASEARIALAEHSPDVVIVSHPFPGEDHSALAAALLDDDPDVALLILPAPGTPVPPADAILPGVVIAAQPIVAGELVPVVDRAAESVRSRAELELRRITDEVREDFLPPPPGLEMLMELAARNADEPVLMVGEPGAGKSILARRIHQASARSAEPFFELQCTANARSQIERRLFGHERGAGGASIRSSRGLLELSADGCVLLRSIASLPFETQSLLLAFIERGSFRRTGGTVELRSRTRVMAATVRPLAPSVDAGLFRSDLYYRLQVLTIAVPPLRERADELERMLPVLLSPGVSVSPAALLALQEHSWPGNLRELRNALWRASILAGNSRIEMQHLPLTAALDSHGGPSAARVRGPRSATFGLAEIERRAILAALEQTGGNKLRAAALLGIARSTLHDKLKRI